MAARTAPAKSARSARQPAASLEDVQGVVDDAVASTATLEPPAAPKNGAKKKPVAEVSTADKIRAAMPNGKSPKSKGRPAAKAKTAVEPESDEDDDFDYDAAERAAASLGRRNGSVVDPDDEDDHDDDQEVAASVERRRSARNGSNHDDDERRSDDIDDELLELAEEVGYTPRKARKEFAELGEKAFRAVLRALQSGGRRRDEDDEDDAPRDRRRAPEVPQDKKQEPELRTDETGGLTYTELTYDEEGLADEAKALFAQLKKHADGHGKGVVEAVNGLRSMVTRLIAESEQRNRQETAKELDRLFSEAKDYHDVYGRVSMRKLPKNSPLRAARQEVFVEMQEIAERRDKRGLDPLDFDELFHKAVRTLNAEREDETDQPTTKTNDAGSASKPRGTTTMRPNSRRNESVRGPGKAASTSLAKQREYGWI